jgi:hypothetical protein
MCIKGDCADSDEQVQRRCILGDADGEQVRSEVQRRCSIVQRRCRSRRQRGAVLLSSAEVQERLLCRCRAGAEQVHHQRRDAGMRRCRGAEVQHVQRCKELAWGRMLQVHRSTGADQEVHRWGGGRGAEMQIWSC